MVSHGQILAGCVLALWLNHAAGYCSFERIRRTAGGLGLVAAAGPVHRLLRWRPLAEVGKLSCGMSLIHFLPMLVGQGVAARLPPAGTKPFVALALAAWVLPSLLNGRSSAWGGGGRGDWCSQPRPARVN